MKKKAKKASKQSHSTKPGRSKFPVAPTGDRVLIREMKKETKEKTETGIYLPETAKEDKSTKMGKVVAVGPGRVEDGKLIAPSVRVGDTVLYQWGDTISHKGEEYVVVRESEILAIVK